MYAGVKETEIAGKEPRDRESYSEEESLRRTEIDNSWLRRERELRAVEGIPTLDESEESGFRVKSMNFQKE